MSEEAVEGTPVTPVVETPKQETVPMSEHIGVKEMLRKRETTLAEAQAAAEKVNAANEQAQTRIVELEADVGRLGEQIQAGKTSAVDPAELTQAKEKLAELQVKSLSGKKEAAVAFAGAKTEDIESMTEGELDIYLKGLGARGGQVEKVETPPGPDLSSGGQPVVPATTARQKMKQGWEERQKE